VKRQLDRPAFLLLIAILFGGLVRFMPAILVRFPINDGGMFYTMAGELSSNGYALPAVTTYNGWNLPYAYPPLGIYLATLLADFGRVPLLTVFLWLPPLLSLLAIPAFYLFARALLSDDLHAALATLFFALTPGRYDWHVMGGGVTRAAFFAYFKKINGS
jgi:asparagine N-glycosylation enzyme membrane subunit Stt3